MHFDTFVRKPFVVEAVQVTEDNINSIAKSVGVIKKNSDGSPFILPNRKLFPNNSEISLGYWMTRMGKQLRFYSPSVFNNQFIRSNDDVEMLCKAMNNHHEEEDYGSTSLQHSA